MQTKFRVPLIDDAVDQGRAEGEAEGEIQGIIKSLVQILSTRFSGPVPDPRRAEISECADAELLLTWTRRAVVARTIDEVFDDTCKNNGNV